VKKQDLERALQALEPVRAPRPDIEQYATPAGIAAEVAYIALGKGDLAGRTVLDAGCGAGVLALAFFPELAISMLFGMKFAAAAPLLKYYGMAMVSMAIVSVLMTFNLARGNTGFIYSLIAGTIALAVFFHIFEGSLLSTVLVMVAVNTAVASYNLYAVMRERKAWEIVRLDARSRSAM